MESGTDQLTLDPERTGETPRAGSDFGRAGQRLKRGTLRDFLRRFAVHGVLWRNYLDWAVANVPFYFQPVIIAYWTVFFFFFAAPARRAVLANLAVVLPGSSRWMNYLRTYRTLMNFAFTIGDAANYKVNRSEFRYEIDGAEALEQLANAQGAIVLTAHMGSYDLGAAIFAQKFGREIRMVRAPEPDAQSGEHLHDSVRRTGAGAVKIAYSTDGALLSFDLLGALRRGEIVSIQGDRVVGEVATVEGRMFGARVRIPTGPFTLAQITGAPVFPLFIIRAGHRRYRIVVRPPIFVERTSREREQDIAPAVAKWCEVLEKTIASAWQQWFAFAPIFLRDGA